MTTQTNQYITKITPSYHTNTLRKNFRYKDKTFVGQSYLYNGNPYTRMDRHKALHIGD